MRWGCFFRYWVLCDLDEYILVESNEPEELLCTHAKQEHAKQEMERNERFRSPRWRGVETRPRDHSSSCGQCMRELPQPPSLAARRLHLRRPG